MNIILIGYRGTGKSTIARLLAKKLKRKLLSTDAMIVERVGKPIPDIVLEWGWPRFREMEYNIIREISDKEDARVIDCGGGVVLDERNVRNLRENGKIVLLSADFDVILKRIRRDANRPPLREGLSFEDEQRQVFAEREPLYRSAADLVLDTSHARPEATADQIVLDCKKNAWI
jgi:shikimate kinase